MLRDEEGTLHHIFKQTSKSKIKIERDNIPTNQRNPVLWQLTLQDS